MFEKYMIKSENAVNKAIEAFFRKEYELAVFWRNVSECYKNKAYNLTVLKCCKEINQYCHINDIVPFMVPLPGYKMLKKVKVGKWKLFGIFKPNIYHCIYGDESLYENL